MQIVINEKLNQLSGNAQRTLFMIVKHMLIQGKYREKYRVKMLGIKSNFSPRLCVKLNKKCIIRIL